jgi:hypothetical protein
MNFNEDSAKYPNQSVEMHNYVIPTCSQHHKVENIFVGRAPSCMIIGFILHASVNLDYVTNAIHFQHFNVNYITLLKHGDSVNRASKQIFSRQ